MNLPEINSHLRQIEWTELTLQQLIKDANLCGIEWISTALPTDHDSWIGMIYENLLSMEKQNPEYLTRFLYRVDLPEKAFLQSPFPSENMAEAVLKREFMKVWFKSQYKP